MEIIRSSNRCRIYTSRFTVLQDVIMIIFVRGDQDKLCVEVVDDKTVCFHTYDEFPF